MVGGSLPLCSRAHYVYLMALSGSCILTLTEGLCTQGRKLEGLCTSSRKLFWAVIFYAFTHRRSLPKIIFLKNPGLSRSFFVFYICFLLTTREPHFPQICSFRSITKATMVYHLKASKNSHWWTNVFSKSILISYFRAPWACLTQPSKIFMINCSFHECLTTSKKTKQLNHFQKYWQYPYPGMPNQTLEK